MRLEDVSESMITISFLPDDCLRLARLLERGAASSSTDIVLSETYSALFAAAGTAGQLQADWGAGEKGQSLEELRAENQCMYSLATAD